MTQYLPPNLLALFAPRDPIQYLPPVDKLPHEKKCNTYTGIGAYVNLFEDPKDTPPPTRIETKEERLERKRREKAEMAAYKLEQEIAMWDPSNNPSSTSDAFKTLFVARINYDTSESKLRREFEVYGTIRRITMAQNTQNGKPRGYAFIEYEHERDMHAAYKHADGKKIDGRRILVDVERGRTVKGWLPRRLGGGLGGTRRGGADVNTKYSGREDGGRTEERGDRDRDRDRERRKSKSRSREREVRKRRSRSRSRDRRRERERKPHRSRSRERDRAERGDRDRERERPDREERAEGDNDKEAPEESAEGVQPESEDVKPPRELGRDRKRSRSRDRDRDRRRRRSRSRSRDRRRRDRDRDRERGRGDRDRERDRKRERDDVHVKQEKEGEDGGFANGKPDPDAPYTNNPEDFVGYIKTEPMDDTYNGEDY